MIIRISSGVSESLRAEAARAYPHECCGLVTGEAGLIEAIVPARNISPQPDKSFEIDPGTLLQTHRNVRAERRQVIGHYHSHPDGNAQPSPRDAARAVHNGEVWIIIAGAEVTGWQTVDPDQNALHGRFHPVQLHPV